MSVLPSPQSTHKFYQADGVTPAAAYEVYTYAAGTTTPLATYSDAVGVSANTNPIILNANGEASIYVTAGVSYDLVLKYPGGGAQIGATQRVIVDGDSAIRADISGSSGASMVGFLQAGTGAVARTAQAKMRESISAEDFGAVGDGVASDTAAINAAIAAAAGKPVFLNSTTYNTGALTASGARIVGRRAVVDNSLNFGLGIDDADLPAAQAMTYGAGERYVQSFRNSATSANAIYNAIFPGIHHYDALQGVTQIVAGSTIEHATGIAGYVKSDDAAITNGVAVFGCGMATVNSAAVWGLNTLLQDSATRAVGSLTGVFLVNELDFNVMCPGTTVIGMSLGGNSLSTPTDGTGFVVNPLGTGIKWTTAFFSQDGAANNGLAIGAASTSGSNIDSQFVLLNYFTAGSVKQNVRIRVTGGGYLEFNGSIAPLGYLFKSSDIFLDTGRGVRINGNVIITDRKTGYTAFTGTVNRGTSYATGSVTLVQLAERVAALQADLTSHGLIGA